MKKIRTIKDLKRTFHNLIKWLEEKENDNNIEIVSDAANDMIDNLNSEGFFDERWDPRE